MNENPSEVATPDVERLVEARITKSEFVDLLVDDMRQHLQDRLERLPERTKKIIVTVADIPELVRQKVELFPHDDGTAAVNLRDEVSIAKLPTEIREKIAAHREVEKEREAIQEQIEQLGRKGRLVALRALLDQTKDGKRLLKVLDETGAGFRRKLLSAKAG